MVGTFMGFSSLYHTYHIIYVKNINVCMNYASINTYIETAPCTLQ